MLGINQKQKYNDLGTGLKKNFKDIPRHLNVNTITNGIVAWLFGVTGPLLIVLQSAEQGNLDASVTSSWVFAIYVIGGILTLLLSLYYRQPIAVAFSIPGAVLVGTSLSSHAFPEVIGAYVITGLLIFILGVTGIVNTLMKYLPMPIMMGMVSGVLLPFGVNIFVAVHDGPLLNGLTLLTFLTLSVFAGLARKFPPIMGALMVAGVLVYTLDLVPAESMSFEFAQPQFVMPEFSLGPIAELVIPLTITVIAIQNAQGIGVLKGENYIPPVNAMTNWSGIGSVINSIFGAHSACIAGPMTAIMSGKDTGEKQGRYVAAVVMGFLWLIFGILAPVSVLLVQTVPSSLIQLLGGLAMLGVLLTSLQTSFSSSFKMGALFSFIITISGVTFFGIGAPFWGLVGGSIVSLVLEQKDYQALFQKTAETTKNAS